MTKILWQCDKCGKLTELSKEPKRYRLITRLLPLEPVLNYTVGYDESELATICKECWEDVREFIKGGTKESHTKKHVANKGK